MKTLLLDIENSPPAAWVYGPSRVKFIPAFHIKEEGEILCFAAKWLGSRNFFFHSLYGDSKDAMLKAAWELLDEADVVMTYYGRRHDIPILNREFLLAGMKPPSPYKHIDLYFVIRQTFGFDYKSLDYVTQRLGFKGKSMKLSIPFMVRCLAGEEKAWRQMARYNKQDVRLLEELYEFLQPWIKGHPSHGALKGAGVCPKCGSDDLERRGFAYTQQGKFQRWHCLGCGGWSRETKRLDGATLVEAA